MFLKSYDKISPRKDLVYQKVGIFIDAENIELSGLKHHEARTDYKKILDQVGEREVLRVLYYKPDYKEISSDFSTFWRSLGGEIKRPSKNADTFLTIDAVTMADKLDVVIILGGDKDFLPLIWYLKSRGCRVEIWSWPESTSPEVKDAADVYMALTKEYVIAKSEEANRPHKKKKALKKPGTTSVSGKKKKQMPTTRS
jgi:uncharacterized LabA/DUF88 family protein